MPISITLYGSLGLILLCVIGAVNLIQRIFSQRHH